MASGKYFAARASSVCVFGIRYGLRSDARYSSISIVDASTCPLRFPGNSSRGKSSPSCSHTPIRPAIVNGRDSGLGTESSQWRIMNGKQISITHTLYVVRMCFRREAVCSDEISSIRFDSLSQQENSRNSNEAVGPISRVS